MIVENEGNKRFLRYPGARRVDDRWSIPIVARGGGSETFVEWVPVIEEILPPATVPPRNPLTTPFQASSPERGLVALRINFAFQAATLTAYNQRAVGANRVQNIPVEAPGLAPGEQPGPYAGADGLGKQLALGKTVRPFRRVLTAQGLYRREVFR
jgi:hypothetical protein